MPNKKSKVEYDTRYIKEHYDSLLVKVKKDSMIKSRLETLSISTNKSKNQLIIEAIEAYLQREGL